MKLHELEYTTGSRKKDFRKGRGIGSGNGKTSGKGHKGQNSRSGGGVRLGFEGGQNPLYRRLPKRGFTNISRKNYAIVDVERLNCFEKDTIVTPTLMIEKGLISKEKDGIKVIGNGKVEVVLTVKANKFSKSAEQAIVNAGGTVEVI